MKKLKGINFDKDKKALMDICRYSETDASDFAYMAAEAAAWDSIYNLISINKGEVSAEALNHFIKAVHEAVIVARTTKIILT